MRWDLIFQFAGRFLKSKTSSLVLAKTTRSSVLGVVLGVCALGVAMGIMNGFRDKIQSAITKLNGNVLVLTRGQPIDEIDSFKKVLKKKFPAINEVSDSLSIETMLIGPEHSVGTLLEGISQKAKFRLNGFESLLKNGRLPKKDGEILLTKSLAKKLGVQVGELVQVAAFEKNSNEGLPRFFYWKVVGLIEFSMHHYDSRLSFATKESVAQLTGWHLRQANTFQVLIQKNFDDFLMAQEIEDFLQENFRVRHWASLNQNVFYAIKVEKAMIALILTAILCIAALNVVSALVMMSRERRKDLALIRAFGMTQKEVVMIFAMMGLMIAVLGSGIGFALSWIFSRLLEKMPFLTLPSDVYYVGGKIKFFLNFSDFCMILIGVILLCVFASLLTGYRVIVKNPWTGIRDV